MSNLNALTKNRFQFAADESLSFHYRHRGDPLRDNLGHMGTGSELITVISPDRGHCLLWASFHTYRPSRVANSTLAKYILSSGRRPLAAKPTIVSIVFLHLLQTRPCKEVKFFLIPFLVNIGNIGQRSLEISSDELFVELALQVPPIAHGILR